MGVSVVVINVVDSVPLLFVASTESNTMLPLDICSFIIFSKAVFDMLPAEVTTGVEVSLVASLLKSMNFMLNFMREV